MDGITDSMDMGLGGVCRRQRSNTYHDPRAERVYPIAELQSCTWLSTVRERGHRGETRPTRRVWNALPRRTPGSGPRGSGLPVQQGRDMVRGVLCKAHSGLGAGQVGTSRSAGRLP